MDHTKFITSSQNPRNGGLWTMQLTQITYIVGYYILKAKKLHDDSIKLCKTKPCMAMQNRMWITTFFFKNILNFFKKSIPMEFLKQIDIF